MNAPDIQVTLRYRKGELTGLVLKGTVGSHVAPEVIELKYPGPVDDNTLPAAQDALLAQLWALARH